MTSQPIRILLVEDSYADAQLIMYEMRKGGLDVVFEQVDTLDALVQSLRQFNPDIILSDYSIPGFSGMKALEISQRDCPDVPFIFVSGTIGEERAIDALRHGATDYVLKDNNKRLVPSVRRALQEAQGRRAHQQAEQARDESEKRFRLFMDHLPAAAFMKDLAGYFTYVNSEFEKLTGKTSEQLAELTVADLGSRHFVDALSANDEQILSQNGTVSLIAELPVNSIPHFFLMQKFQVPGSGLHETMIGGIALDVTGSYYDALTGLANSQLFFDRLKQLLELARTDSRRLAVVVVDVQKFRHINDTLGRSAADDVLRKCAQRLQTIFDGTLHTLARLSGDRFVAAVIETNEGEFSSCIRHWIHQLQFEPESANGMELHVAVKIGVALSPIDGQHSDALFRNAEAALQRAKETTDACVFYSSEMNARVAERLRFETRLHKAVEQHQFQLYYQPKVDLQTREILGLEALIRWADPDRGMISPLEFIPLLEQSGMIVDVGRWIFQQAMADIKRWREAGLAAPRVAVNVSQVQLRQKDFVDLVFSSIGYVPGQEIVCDLEITESLIMEDSEASIEKLRRLRAAGMRIFMDDFGTGYSSLSQVAALPLDALKIDRAFIANMHEDRTLVSTIISLAQALQIDVVAEGVETEEQASMLTTLRCGQAQGYLIARPVSASDIMPLLRPAQP